MASELQHTGTYLPGERFSTTARGRGGDGVLTSGLQLHLHYDKAPYR